MKHEERFDLAYIGKDGTEKHCYPRSREKRDENLRFCEEHCSCLAFWDLGSSKCAGTWTVSTAGVMEIGRSTRLNSSHTLASRMPSSA